MFEAWLRAVLVGHVLTAGLDLSWPGAGLSCRHDQNSLGKVGDGFFLKFLVSFWVFFLESS